jgi:putative tricarboxylic transport membrane protein
VGVGVQRINHRDLLLGAIFALIGAGFVIAARGLDMGTPQRMGPGLFPLILAAVLMLLGIVIAAQAFFITIRGLGLVGAVALAIVTASFASQRAGLVLAALLTLGLTVFCVLVFSYGLGLPIPLRGPWLAF